MKKFSKTFQFGRHTVLFETGEIARQATSAVLVTVGETVVLVTVVAKKDTVEGRDFFPLTVNYLEKTYAAGRIPGGYFKREGKPSEKESLISRLIDRPIRPLFPKGFTQEVQIVAMTMSLDPAVSPDIPAMLGASCALAISGIPFEGPIGGARVGYIDGELVLNPDNAQLASSKLDLVVAGTDRAVLMVESSAQELPEAEMLRAVQFGHQEMQVAINAIREFADEVGTVAWNWQPTQRDGALHNAIVSKVQEPLQLAYKIMEKTLRLDRIQTLREDALKTFCTGAEDAPSETVVNNIFHDLESEIVRGRILAGEPRIDGRDLKTVRPITIRVGVLPRVHGSALFTRGETQALVISTLGTERDAQMIEDIEGDRRDNFMLHYNFPPFSVGETGQLGAPKRREIGHGRLAKRAVAGVVPELGDFPYVIRTVSEITESNGSSSMATVCGSSLSMMDAGVPIKAPVAGIAMGLILEGDRYAVLTDILGDEDHLGDMDFKVAGTANGVTALQMDIKISGITAQIMSEALEQARVGRLHILSIMNQTINAPRSQVSELAPRIISFSIHPDKIREVIGKGGVTIRDITETTNSTIDISDDGVVKVAAMCTADAEAARKRIEEIVADVEVGRTYEGKVAKIVDFGAFVSFMGGTQGLVHISQITNTRVNDVREHLQEGQAVRVKVVEIDRQGRIRLSMKDVEPQEVNS